MSLSTDLNAKYGRSYLTFQDVDNAQKDISLFDDSMTGSLPSSEEETFNLLFEAVLLDPLDGTAGFYIVDEDDIIEGMTPSSQNAPDPKATDEFKSEVDAYKQKAAADGLIYATTEQLDKVELMVARAKKSSSWNNYLSGPPFEEIFSDEVVGDGTFNGTVTVIDGSILSVKVTSLDADEWESEAYSKNFDMEAYINYIATGKATYFLVQEQSDPYLPAFYKAGTTLLTSGQSKLEGVLDRIQDFLDDYPTDPDEYSYVKTL